MSVAETILKATRILYPTGRAFKMPFGGDLERLHKALAQSESRAYNDAVSVLNSAIPDNAGFLEDDATAWEKRLGLITNPAVSLDDRKLAITRKMNHPGDIPARQNYRYIEKQLQDAGFDVHVYENRFPDGLGGYDTQTPEEVTGIPSEEVQHGNGQHGDAQHGGDVRNIVANYINDDVDRIFNIGTNLRSTFFIGGDPIGTFADVDVERKQEFRQLILRTKPAQTVAFLFVNYI